MTLTYCYLIIFYCKKVTFFNCFIKNFKRTFNFQTYPSMAFAYYKSVWGTSGIRSFMKNKEITFFNFQISVFCYILCIKFFYSVLLMIKSPFGRSSNEYFLWGYKISATRGVVLGFLELVFLERVLTLVYMV